jgi:hypothetical protein
MTLAMSLFAQNEDLGTTGFAFLNTKYSARASAMANAFTGISNDGAAVFFNPGGLVQTSGYELSSTYISLFDGVQGGSVVYSMSRSEKRSMAFFGQFLTATEIKTLADDAGNYLGTDGEFGYSDIIVGISDSHVLTDLLNLGVSIKYIMESIDGNSASAVVADIGVLNQTANEDLKMGVTVKNLGKQITYFTDTKYKENLPTIVTVGFGYHPDEKLFTDFEVNKPIKGDFTFRAGAEYLVHEMIKLRAGYNADAKDWKTGGDSELFAGLSFGFGVEWKKYTIDYAINSYGDLGFINQISLKMNF